jgi:hypothetical protein
LPQFINGALVFEAIIKRTNCIDILSYVEISSESEYQSAQLEGEGDVASMQNRPNEFGRRRNKETQTGVVSWCRRGSSSLFNHYGTTTRRKNIGKEMVRSLIRVHSRYSRFAILV